jgi:hypothetical protein
LDVHRNAGFSVFAGCGEVKVTEASAFDFAFRLESTRLADGRTGHAVCEKGIPAGPLRAGSPVSWQEIPLLVNVVSRATAGL